MDRKKHTWKVDLVSTHGHGTAEVTFESHWDPAKTDTDTIGKAAAIQHSRKTKAEYVHTAVTAVR